MGSVTQAVILAAGSGTRIAGHIAAIPKGFIEIEGRPIIERSIEILFDEGIERVLIVTGYLSHFYEDLERKYPGVETIRNDRFRESGSMYSLYRARDSVDGSFLLLESDIVFETRAISSLLEAAPEGTGRTIVASVSLEMKRRNLRPALAHPPTAPTE